MDVISLLSTLSPAGLWIMAAGRTLCVRGVRPIAVLVGMLGVGGGQ